MTSVVCETDYDGAVMNEYAQRAPSGTIVNPFEGDKEKKLCKRFSAVHFIGLTQNGILQVD